MSSQDSHVFADKSYNGSNGITRPSKLPLFGRRSSDKHPPPPTSLPSESIKFTNTPLGRVRPSTIVKPFFASHCQPNANVNESQRRRLPPSQPSTPVRSSQPEINQDYQQTHRSSHFLRPAGSSASSTSKRIDTSSEAIPQSLSFSGSRNVQQNPQQQQPRSCSSKSKSYRMENMSVEHLQYLERRLQQLLEVIPPRPGEARSDSGRQSSHPSWMAVPPQGHSLHQSHQALPHYPMITNPYHFHPQAAPLLIFPPRQQTGPSQSAAGGSEVFGELDPYYFPSSSSASFCYAGSAPSSLQDFNREELHYLLHAVRNMLAMHQQNQSSSTSKSASSTNPDPLTALQQRPYSWYLHRTTTPSSPASSTVNLFLDDSDSMNTEGSDSGRSTGKDNVDDTERQKSASESGSHPPILPAGFRNFTRYLDSKFGPDTTEEQRSKRHHHHQRRHRRELLKSSSHAITATDSSRGRSVADVRPKISITPCASDGEFAESSPCQSGGSSTGSPSSLKVVEGELAQRLAATWCAPYWCPPPLPPSAAWYHQVASNAPPLPPPPPPSRYYAPPPQNTAAACWFRAAANHFATAAAIFAADNAAAASAMVGAPIPQFHSNRRGHPTPSPPAYYSQNPSMNLPSSASQLQSGEYVPGGNNGAEEEDEDDFFVISDEEDQQQPRQRRQRRLPAVEPLQRQFWGSRGGDTESANGGSVNQTTDDVECGLDMLPQDPALILPDQVDFYAQIKDLLELDSNISLPLPAGWAVGVSSSGRRSYVSCPSGDSASSRNRTRTTTWQHPVIASRIPLGWERVEMRRENCVYYRHLLIPHTQRHHPDLWFPTSMKNVEFEQQSWFFDLRKLQESVSNFDKGNSQLIESYVDTSDPSEEARFGELLKRYGVGELENLLKHLDCRFFRDLHRMVVAFEVARIRIVRELFVQHIQRTNANVAEVTNSHANPESSQSA